MMQAAGDTLLQKAHSAMPRALLASGSHDPLRFSAQIAERGITSYTMKKRAFPGVSLAMVAPTPLVRPRRPSVRRRS